MLRFALLSVAFLAAANPASAATFFAENVDGAQTLEALDAPNFWSPEIADATIFLYPEIEVHSQLGTMTLAMTCIIPKSSNSNVELALSFTGEGILGYKRAISSVGNSRTMFATFSTPFK